MAPSPRRRRHLPLLLPLLLLAAALRGAAPAAGAVESFRKEKERMVDTRRSSADGSGQGMGDGKRASSSPLQHPSSASPNKRSKVTLAGLAPLSNKRSKVTLAEVTPGEGARHRGGGGGAGAEELEVEAC
ncbi:hypothetical protein ZWY2020_005016 [Hordeum vulgare]|nr:hypothetical protein ZWY2020_005016 [Hordeum vulgare]